MSRWSNVLTFVCGIVAYFVITTILYLAFGIRVPMLFG